jgi:hypothetical protein
MDRFSTHLIALYITGLLVCAFNACSVVRQPSAGTADLQASSFSHAGVTNNCSSCHGAGDPFAAFPATGHLAINGADCSTCHQTTTWLSAYSLIRPHAITGSTATSPFRCETCHGNSGLICSNGDNCHLAMAPVANGSSDVYAGHFYDGSVSTTQSYCINCHTDYSSFKTALSYNHNSISTAVAISGTSYASGVCINCHRFANGTYTSLTSNVQFDNSAAQELATGYWTMRDGASVSGSNSGGSFTDVHSSAKMQPDCSTCHTYSANHNKTSAVWNFVHHPANIGAPSHIKNNSQQGCNECH